MASAGFAAWHKVDRGFALTFNLAAWAARVHRLLSRGERALARRSGLSGAADPADPCLHIRGLALPADNAGAPHSCAATGVAQEGRRHGSGSDTSSGHHRCRCGSVEPAVLQPAIPGQLALLHIPAGDDAFVHRRRNRGDMVPRGPARFQAADDGGDGADPRRRVQPLVGRCHLRGSGRRLFRDTRPQRYRSRPHDRRPRRLRSRHARANSSGHHDCGRSSPSASSRRPPCITPNGGPGSRGRWSASSRGASSPPAATAG